MLQKNRRVGAIAALVILLAVMEAFMLLSVRQESPTADEPHNLVSGYLYLTRGDFSAGSAHPPLAKDVSALPLLALHPRVPPLPQGGPFDINLQDGRAFLEANDAERIVFAARAMMTVFPLLLAALVFVAAYEMFGAAPASIALILIAFEPNLLAHGALATNDVALATCLFAGVYSYWRYTQRPSAGRLILAGVAGGLTLSSKHSGLLLFPILLLVALIDPVAPRPQSSRSCDDDSLAANPKSAASVPSTSGVRRAFALGVVGLISVAVLWAFYAFRFAPQSGIPAPDLTPLLDAVSSKPKVAAITLAARLHLLPLGYLAGLAHFFVGESRPTYLLGTRYAHGVWFYFPTALTIKCTLGFLSLLALAPFGLRFLPGKRREILWMAIPAGLYLAASMTSNLNIGVRYILPIVPFFAVILGAAGAALMKKGRVWVGVVALLVGFHAASSLRAYPNFLAYSNEVWGGPSRTYRYLTDSNVDWGQGLIEANRYLESHSSSPCWFAYFGTVDPAQYHIPCHLLTVSSTVVWGRTLEATPPVVNGTVLVSATEMSGQAWGPGELNPYDQFRDLRPSDSIGGSILVYRGTFSLPLAAALSTLGQVVELANHGDFAAALARVDAAAALAPRSVDVQFVRGRLLKVMGRGPESQQAFANAMNFATTIHPEAQSYWVPIIEKEMQAP
jgi:hypothetical protein